MTSTPRLSLTDIGALTRDAHRERSRRLAWALAAAARGMAAWLRASTATPLRLEPPRRPAYL